MLLRDKRKDKVMETNITVVDSIMGSSKTTYFIEYMKNNPDKRFIYITPFLDEIKRVQSEVPFLRSPKAVNGRKMENFKKIIMAGNSVGTTHAMLSRFDLQTQEAIEVGEYELILDEVAEVVHPFQFDSESDKKTFFEDLGGVDDEGYLYWDKEKNPIEDYKGRYYDIMILCENRNLVQVDGRTYMWELPINIFKKFSKVHILTYLFNGSYQKSYFDLFGINYNYKSMKNGTLVDYEETSPKEKAQIKRLINITDNERLNKIGEPDFSLSSTWFKNNVKKSGRETVFQKSIRLNLDNWFQNICKGKSIDNMWSVYKSYETRLKGKGYTKGFVSYNSRATNDYRHKKNLAYVLNLFPHTSMTMYFREKDIEIDSDEYALSILLQWIWRSRIRDYKSPEDDRKINLYLPSLRMRTLLNNWLDSTD